MGLYRLKKSTPYQCAGPCAQIPKKSTRAVSECSLNARHVAVHAGSKTRKRYTKSPVSVRRKPKDGSISPNVHRERTRAWLSLYVYPVADINSFVENEMCRFLELISESVHCSKLSSRFFFVRYHDWLGDHLRIRHAVRTENELCAARDRLIARFTAESQFYGGAKRIRFVRYRAELRRYGGSSRIHLAENFFCESSAWTLANRKVIYLSRTKRMAVAAICAVILIKNVSSTTDSLRRQAGRFFAFEASLTLGVGVTSIALSAEHLLSQYGASAEQWDTCFRYAQQLDSKEQAKGENLFSAWCSISQNSVCCLKESFRRTNPDSKDKIDSILMSWIHMHNNRLGLIRLEEAYVYAAITLYGR